MAGDYPSIRGTGLKRPRDIRWWENAPYRQPDPIGLPVTDRRDIETQYRGQAPHLNNPMVRQIIVSNASSEANIDKLIQVFGIATVERVLREDVMSGEFHTEQDTREFSTDDANIEALDELSRRRNAGEEYGMPSYQRRRSDWKR